MDYKKQTIRILSYIHSQNHSVLPIALLLAWMESLTIYLNLHLMAGVLDRLLEKDWKGLLIWLVILVGFELVWGLLVDGLSEYYWFRCVARLTWDSMGRIYEKAMTIDYTFLEDPKQMEKLNSAKFNLQHTGGFGYFLMYCQQLFRQIFTILVAGAALLELCIKQGSMPASTGGLLYSRWFCVILLFGVMVLESVINFAQEGWRAKTEIELHRLSMELEYKFSYYYREVLRDYAKGKTIRLYRMRDMITERYHGFIQWGCELMKKAVPYNTKTELTGQVSSGLVGLCAYGVVALRVISGAVSAGSFLKYTGMINQLNAAVLSMIACSSQLRIRCEYLQVYLDFLECPNRLATGTIPVEKRTDQEFEIEFHHVSFAYPGSEQYVLKDVSCKLDMKHKFAVVGRNGAGKTTFIKLLCRLYDPTEGSITLNGVDIRKYDYQEYLNLFSVVFQDFSLFSGPLAENVAAGMEVEQDKLWNCLELAGIKERVEELPQRTDTPLYSYEEGGVEISGGEAQKLAIARALYKDAPFVILDEPTAALDPISEYEIYHRFQELVRDKTSIYISHRMSSCRFCDRIYVFADGGIAETGDHDSLMEQGGIYAELFEAQAKYYQSAIWIPVSR